jgi:hypothetical protein
LRSRGEVHRAISLGEAFFSGALTAIYYLNEEDIRGAWQVFRQFSDDVPEEFQTELAALDRLDNESLWKIAQSRKTPTEMEGYTLLLEKKQEGNLTAAEQLELAKLRHEADLFMLRKAQATVLLRWRGERLGAD